MEERKILFGCLFLQILLYANAGSYYTLVAPEILKAGTDYSAAITLHYNTEPSVVKVGIYGPSINSTKTLDLGIFNTGVAKFDIPALEHGIYKLKVQGVKGMIFGNVTELKCDFDMDIMEDMEQLVNIKTQKPTNGTIKRTGLFNFNKDKNRRIAPDFTFAIDSNETIPYLVYALVANGKLHSHKYLEVEGNGTTEYIIFTPTTVMKPLSYLYVYFIKNDELIWMDNWLSFVPSPSKNESRNLNADEWPEVEKIREQLLLDMCNKTQPGELSGLIVLTNASPSGNKVEIEIAVHPAVLEYFAKKKTFMHPDADDGIVANSETVISPKFVLNLN